MTPVVFEMAQTRLLLCSREQVKQGFMTEPNRNASMPYRSTTWEETCYQNPIEYYKSYWSVDEPCQLTEWDPYLLCEILGNKTLGFLGDSISWQNFRSMKYLLGATPTIDKQTLKEFQCCANNIMVFWNRNYKLVATGVQGMIVNINPTLSWQTVVPIMPIMIRMTYFLPSSIKQSTSFVNGSIIRTVLWFGAQPLRAFHSAKCFTAPKTCRPVCRPWNNT
ncbi:hypothetical protein ACHAWX_003224 [Stephanocyclus meneghinianus]